MMVLERDGSKCACCGKTAADQVIINVDHIKPRRFHPELALTLSNLQVLCEPCNHGKGNKYETKWRRETLSLPIPASDPRRLTLRALLLTPTRINASYLVDPSGSTPIEAATRAVVAFVGSDGDATTTSVLEHFSGTEFEAVLLREAEALFDESDQRRA
jgi:hypothetical protein